MCFVSMFSIRSWPLCSPSNSWSIAKLSDPTCYELANHVVTITVIYIVDCCLLNADCYTKEMNQQLQPDAFDFIQVQANSINHRVAAVRGFPPSPSASLTASRNVPLIMLLHGWPESWYSWRHQLLVLADAGYHVCAPDMRGYGDTDAPMAVEEYTIDVLCKDVIQIAQQLGYLTIIVVGHDLGAYLAWHIALLHRDCVLAVCAMSIPYMGHSPSNMPMLTQLQQVWGKSLTEEPYCARKDEQESAHFHYILHHNLPYADQEYNKNTYEALYRLYTMRPSAAQDPPEMTDKFMFPTSHRVSEQLDARSAPGLWARLPRSFDFPDWLTTVEFEYYVREFQRNGFAGGLSWYKALDANWFQTRHLQGEVVQQPALFIVGEHDTMVLENHGGMNRIIKAVRKNCKALISLVVLPKTGHWIQQERPNEVNEALLAFLDSLPVELLSKL